jgi:hypothetical protein
MNALIRHGFNAVAVLAVLAFLPGCGYTLRGKVVHGEVSSVEMVHEIDPRLKQPGIANVETLVRHDPKDRDSQLVARARTNAAGEFSMPIREYGAGWMQQDWLVQARHAGFHNASSLTKLPAQGGKWRLLITLGPGTATSLETSEEFTPE